MDVHWVWWLAQTASSASSTYFMSVPSPAEVPLPPCQGASKLVLAITVWLSDTQSNPMYGNCISWPRFDTRCENAFVLKQDGVCPLDNRTSTDYVHCFFECLFCEVRHNIWHMTHDIWQMTLRGWWVLSQYFRSLALMVWDLQSY